MRERRVPPYYRVRNGRAFWEPGKFGEQYGMPKSAALGPDSYAAKDKAEGWNAALIKARAGERVYPKGALGAWYFGAFKTTDAWALMTPGTQALYDRAWPHIDKRFGSIVLTHLTATDSERFHVDLHPQHENPRDPKREMKLSWFMAHLVLKHWRLLLTALVDYNWIPAPAPIGRVSNPAPPSRSEVWTWEEVELLIAAATAMGEHGMAVGLRLGWETMMSTPDCRSLPIAGWVAPRPGEDAGTIETRRLKSGAIVRATSTPELDAAITAYLRDHHPTPHDAGAPLLIRGGTGKPFIDRHAFKQVFASVREAAFPGDRRQFGDMRRSGATEARLGGASDADIGPSMANQLAKDEGLQSTYIVAASQTVQAARKAGRSKHSAKFRKSES